MAQFEHAPTVLDSGDLEPVETAEWLASLRYVLDAEGPQRARALVSRLNEVLAQEGLATHGPLNTPYINTIPLDRQPPYPGDRALEERIESLIRWNAMAMVSRANHEHHGIGGHISTCASTATLFEVGLNHFFQGKGDDHSGDLIYFQGHASPGLYARAFLEGRLSEQQLIHFRQELAPGGGLSSYPHPWLMPDFWEFSTVSMGLGPILAIYQARPRSTISRYTTKTTRCRPCPRAATDFVRAVPEQISPWVPGGLSALGTDGLGRSDTRGRLRRHFEVDAECIGLAALTQLAERGQFEKRRLPKVIEELEIDPDKVDPLSA